MNPDIKFLTFQGKIIPIHKHTDQQWRDSSGTIYALEEASNMVDPVSRCGVGVLSLSTDSKYTPGCAPHDYAYSSTTYQLYHTFEEANDMLRRNITILGNAFLGRVFQLVAGLFGKRFWENKETRL